MKVGSCRRVTAPSSKLSWNGDSVRSDMRSSREGISIRVSEWTNEAQADTEEIWEAA